MGQITRHRTACFSIRSQRYVDEEGFNYVTPDAIKKNPYALVLYQNAMGFLNGAYEALKDEGIPREDARMVLPNSCETTINMSMTFEGWLHYLRRRMDNKAQKEIRELAFEQYRLLHKECPLIFNETTVMAPSKINIEWDDV
jgi:thymidylate synthase (FAD)